MLREAFTFTSAAKDARALARQGTGFTNHDVLHINETDLGICVHK